MNDKQLDAVLEYLNDEDGVITLEDVQLTAINEGIVDKIKKAASGFKPIKKSFLGSLFKKKAPDLQQVIKDFDLEKIEGKNDLFICHKYQILGKDPFIHIPLALIAPYPNNLKLFLGWSDTDVNWDKVFEQSFASRAKIDYTDVSSDVKNKKLVAVYTTKSYEGGYVNYKTFAVYSIKSKTLKNAKYHTCSYRFDGQYEYTGWAEVDPESLGIADVI